MRVRNTLFGLMEVMGRKFMRIFSCFDESVESVSRAFFGQRYSRSYHKITSEKVNFTQVTNHKQRIAVP